VATAFADRPPVAQDNHGTEFTIDHGTEFTIDDTIGTTSFFGCHFRTVRMQPSGFAPSWMFDTEHIRKNRTASTSYGRLVVQDHIQQRAVDLQPAHGNEGIARGVTTQKQK
jgi:hypothetical protein